MATRLAFDAQFYLTQNPDVAAAVSRGQFASAEQHYNLNGRFENRDPNAFFDTSYYLGQYPDVAAARVNPFQHFLQFGSTQAEARFANATAQAAIDTDGNGFGNEFNAAAYLAANPDVAAATGPGKSFASAYQHFVIFGQFESRPGTPAGGPFTNTGQAPNAGQTFTLTTGIDNFPGTSANDTFNAVVDTVNAANNTLGVSDTVSGGAGVDRLNVLVNGLAGDTTIPLAGVTNVENFFVRNLSDKVATLDGAAVTGEQQLWNDRSSGTVALTNAATGTVIGVRGDGATVLGATTFSYATATDAVALNIDGGVKANSGTDITNSANGATTATINSTGAANAVDVVTLSGSSSITNVTINATTALTVGENDAAVGFANGAFATSGAKVTVTGAGTVDLNTLAANISEVDASANGGGVTINGGFGATDKFVGGTGNDTLTVDVALTTGSADGGAGTGDRLIVTNDAAVATAAAAGKFTNFEILRAASTGTDAYNLANLAGITSVEIDGTNGATFTGVGSQSFKVIGNEVGNLTLTNSAFNPGGNDALALSFDNSVLKNADGVDAGILTLTNVDTLNLSSVGANLTPAAGSNSISSLAGSTDLNTVNLTGDTNFSLTTAASAINTISAGTFTGVLTVNASDNTAGLSITSGSGNDTITGSAQADVINGGAGNDVLAGLGGADTIVGGDGNDIIVGDGSVSVAAGTPEVQTLTVGTGADNTGGSLSVNILGTSVPVAVAADATTDTVAAAINTAIAGANISGVTAAVTGSVVTITYVAALGNVGQVTFNAGDTGAAAVAATPTQGVSPLTLGSVTTAAADTLTGGAGNDNFVFANNSSIVSAFDTITDLNLGTNAANGRVDILTFQNAGATPATVVTLDAAQQNIVSTAANFASAVNAVAAIATADGNTALFTYGSDTYIFHNGDGNSTFNNAADHLVRVTGVVGTLDVSDIATVA